MAPRGRVCSLIPDIISGWVPVAVYDVVTTSDPSTMVTTPLPLTSSRPSGRMMAAVSSSMPTPS